MTVLPDLYDLSWTEHGERWVRKALTSEEALAFIDRLTARGVYTWVLQPARL